jgi:hypothetical protein
VHLKELKDLQRAIESLKNDVANSKDPTENFKAAESVINDLQDKLVGSEGRYVYECKNKICKNPCKLDLGCKLSDKKFCMDSLDSGYGDFENTGYTKI